ncbi:hypothetical protein RIF29_08009 [Crotalaria pallida]|uniref:Uncharacterized protein n=1 Tax=Crotalaria pallida TaxID=3830 RepID=A0AAN9PCA4_CROPI
MNDVPTAPTTVRSSFPFWIAGARNNRKNGDSMSKNAILTTLLISLIATTVAFRVEVDKESRTYLLSIAPYSCLSSLTNLSS